MSRLKNTLLADQSYARHAKAPMVDVSKGGMYGYNADLGAVVSNTGYSPRPVINLLMQPPRGFRYLPQPELMTRILKNLIENQAKTVTGFRYGQTVESTQRQFGMGGHQLNEMVRVVEEISSVNYAFDERDGAPIHKFWSYFIRMLMAEPTTGQPGIMNWVTGNDIPPDHLTDFYTFTTLHIEPNRLRNKVVNAWLGTGVYPSTSGILESGFDASSAGGDVPEISIEMPGTYLANTDRVLELAQRELDKISYLNAGPQTRALWVSEVSADIRAAEGGYAEQIRDAVNPL